MVGHVPLEDVILVRVQVPQHDHYLNDHIYNMEDFESKEYRHSLAGELKEVRKTNPEKAINILDEAKKTEEYKEAKKIKIKNHKVESEQEKIHAEISSVV